MTITLFTRDGEKESQCSREVLLDIGGDDSGERCSGLKTLHLLIEARQDHNRFDAVVSNWPLQLPFCIGWIERRHDRSNLPGRELGDHELRTIRKQECDTVAGPDSQFGESGSAGVTQSLESFV